MPAYSFLGRTNELTTPPSHDGKLKVCVHGGGGNPLSMKAELDMETLFPNSPVLYVSSDTTNVADNLWRIQDINHRDTMYLAAILHHVSYSLGISYSQTQLIGVSMGAMAALRAANLLHKLKLNSVVAISGTLQDPVTDSFDYKERVLMVNSTKDTKVTFFENGTYNSVVSTQQKISGVVDVFETVEIAEESSTVGFLYHTLAEIKLLYPNFNNRIKEFLTI
jgi:poly(3-hydroxybutyrate) depolymerase